MDKNALKIFAVESRRKLIEDTKYQASLLGISADDIKDPISSAEGMETYQISASTTHTIYDEEIEQRKHLVQEINNKGFENVIEEVAYTWFNRIIAIRYMEINDYIPTRTRVLSSETPGKVEPDIITEALDLDLDFSSKDTEKILDLKEKNKLDELFQFLFIKQCNKLNEILPNLFEKTDNYSELLLNISFNNPNGIIRQLIDNISEDDFTEVEIIGWLYQYYISEQKDLINNVLKSKAIKKEEIPAVTQLFTPEWIVKYMVDNSLGKYWIERNKDSSLKNDLDYFIADNEQSSEIQNVLDSQNQTVNIEDIKFLDPCMGSGHILVYAFDVFFKIYQEFGYIEKEIPQLILENNLFGLDIDKRAFQLAYFALMMKARKYDRRIFKKDLKLNICPINETEKVTRDTIEYIKSKDADLANDLVYLSDKFVNAKEYGSLIQIDNIDLETIENKINDIINETNTDLSDLIYKENISNYIVPLLEQSKILINKYEIVVTNPPYMNKYDKKLKDF
ncbi:MAG: BREX-1 system adenine-specific DNA-methyltransferase PglX, partial [Methanobrevibacter sp.]|nr:BREX-1 system adenine-specific DNA-methyltransferase PglX [Methanobrevibacter sp.]